MRVLLVEDDEGVASALAELLGQVGATVTRVAYGADALHRVKGCDLVLLCNQSLDGGDAVDELLDGMDRAMRNAQWRPNGASEHRRLALLPARPAVPVLGRSSHPTIPSGEIRAAASPSLR